MPAVKRGSPDRDKAEAGRFNSCVRDLASPAADSSEAMGFAEKYALFGATGEVQLGSK